MTNLKRIRLDRGLSIEDLSKRSKISFLNIIDLDSGKYSIKDSPIYLVYPLAVALHCKLSDLLDNED